MPKKLTQENFIEKISKLHPSLDFTKTIYKNSRSKIIITCPIHGDNFILAKNLLTGKGCQKCASLKFPQISKDTWLKRFKQIKRDNISYDKIPDNFTAHEKITFICNIHGDFLQDASSHARGYSCKKCSYSINGPSKKGTLLINGSGWTYGRWQKAGDSSPYFDSFKVYMIRCWNDDEEFYKIGKTYTTLKRRFRCSKKLPYNYEIIKTYKGSAKEISKLEKQLQKENKQYKYTPKIEFKGMHECFKNIPLQISPLL